MKFRIVLATLLSPAAVCGKNVFAHFMVGNTASFTFAKWESNIQLAKYVGIDAFALNMANGENTTDTQLPNAFSAAERNGFQLFFSFDYAGNGPWDKSVVSALIKQYSSSSAYFHRGSQPLVSTFEGPGNADDWTDIKSATDCFFIPDWSSVGAAAAIALADGVADGLFSWDAWPKGPSDTNTYPDASYLNFLKGKPYMAPASPWFYTNLPGFDGKNWLWRGDSLWFDRWQQLISIDTQPEYVQIISWNDFGESHYIGPLDPTQYSAFDIGHAPFNYVANMPHDGWRQLLPFFISLYKTGKMSVTSEGVVGWYRLHPATSCTDGGTTGNTASQLQLEYPPSQIVQDKIFFSAVLASDADVSVTIGGTAVAASWISKPYGGAGIYSGNATTNGATGPVSITISRSGGQVVRLDGATITTACAQGLNNWNAWVSSSWGNAISPVTSVAAPNCTAGFGFGNFDGLCKFTCSNGYCPSGACTCTNLGVADPPPITGTPGYPLAGESPSYNGICNFACNHGYCPQTACGHTEEPTVLPTTGEFLPATCTGGKGPSPFEGLCDYACSLGFCPMHLCTCTSTGPLNTPPSPDSSITGIDKDGNNDYGICNFACQRDYCPIPCSNGTRPGTRPGGVFIEDVNAFCSPLTSAGNDPKTVENWQDWKIDTALSNFIDKFKPGGQKGAFRTNIQDSLLSLYDPSVLDRISYKCNPPATCDLSDISKAMCGNQPELTFIFWAIQNFNNYCVKLAQSVVNSGTIAIAKTAHIIEDFAPHYKNDDLSAGFSLASGLLAVIGGINVFSTVAAAVGVSGIGGAMLGFANGEISEPKFDKFANITNQMGDFLKIAATAIEDFAVHVLEDTPVNNPGDGQAYADDSQGLMQIFRDGTFAEPIDVPVVPDRVLAALTSNLINEVWKDQKPFIVKTTVRQTGIGVCAPSENWKAHVWCDGEDVYLLLVWQDAFFHILGDIGPSPFRLTIGLDGKDKLGDYDMSFELLIRSAMDWQSSTGEFRAPRTKDRMTKYLLSILDDKIQDYQFLLFDMPVCDLAIAASVEGEDRPWPTDVTYCLDEDQSWCKMAIYAMLWCPSLVIDGHEWPWHNDKRP